MDGEELRGGCQCNAACDRSQVRRSSLRYAIARMCGRANAAPAVAWAMFRESQVVFTGCSPTIYEPSPEAGPQT
jgi:hypothetical protein